MSNLRTLVAIFAHPDDEAFGTGGTLAKYARQGVNIHLITATRGEVGQIANTGIVADQPLGVLREQELRCACACYGIKELHLLGYLDGQTTVVPQSEAVYKIVRLLRRLQPQVVISFGPEGIYGHYDHLAIHRWATAAVDIAGQAEWWPQAGPPHTVAKFYHRAMFADQVSHIEKINGRNYVPIDGVPFPFMGYPPEKITTIINVQAFAQAKLNGIRCHASQLTPAHPFLQTGFDPTTDPWFAQEAYILARPYPELAQETKETDLFAGVA
jgi:LmbE family N-acetylglucosaminyl deacetylase